MNKILVTALLAGLVIGFTGIATASSHCDYTVTQGDSIQDAINNASSGETICVEPGTYTENVDIDKNIAVTGTNPATGNNPAVLDGTVELSKAGATLRDLKVAPTTTYDFSGIDPTAVKVTAGDTVVEDNVIEGVTADAAASGDTGTVHGVQVWAQTTITDIAVRNNQITDIHNMGDASAGWPYYGGAVGVKVQGAVEDVDVMSNHVESVHSAGWTYGIVVTPTGNEPAADPTDISVSKNTVKEVNDGSIYDVFLDPLAAPYPGVGLGIDEYTDSTPTEYADASEVVANYNNFWDMPLGALNKDPDHTLDATENYWGHASGPSARTNPASKQVGQGAGVIGDVDWSHYLVKPFGQTPVQTPTPPQRGP